MRCLIYLPVLVGVVGCSDATDTTKAPSNEAAAAAVAAEEKPATAEPAARSGPFGILIGQPLDQLGKTEKIDGSPGLYRVVVPPKEHPAFESVVVVAFPDTGVCTIRGIGRDIPNDPTGTQARGAADRLAEAMSLKYGEPEKTDGCYGSEVDCANRWWMMSLRDSQRYYGYSWRTKNAQVAKAGLSEIDLAVKTQDLQTPYLIAEYRGANGKACEAAVTASDAEAL